MKGKVKIKQYLLNLVFVLFSLFANGQVNESDIVDISKLDVNTLKKAVIRELNYQRSQNGLVKFKQTEALNQAAQFHCSQMNELGFFSHINPSKKEFQTPLQRILHFEGNYPYIAENIARISVIDTDDINTVSYKNTENGVEYYANGVKLYNHTYSSLAIELVIKWMKSEEHRKNILNPDLQETGIGACLQSTVDKGIEKFYIIFTQDLGGY